MGERERERVLGISMAKYLSLVLIASGVSAQVDHPHLAQAWVAMSSGDGEQGMTGKESYLYEDCQPKGATSDTCVQAHIFDYGANTCIKYEVNRGFDSKYSGTYYVKCDAVDCCVKDKDQLPDLKKWDIGQAGPILQDKVVHLGNRSIQDLNNNTILADAWYETFDLPFTKDKVN